MKLSDLATPCALVELDVLERNVARMSERMTSLGVRLRPHVKTHKCVEAARLQVRGHFGGITVSTLAEARAFAAAGFRDITYAFPVPVDRLHEIAKLSLEVDRLNLLLDSQEALRALEHFAAAQSLGFRFPVFLKVDCGDHRAGVDPSRAASLALTLEIARSPHVELAGLLTHAGHSYESCNASEIRAIAGQERDVMVAFALWVREAGVDVREVSVGSTPTMNHIDDLSGVSEARPGNYVFHDAYQAAIGSCSLEDCAMSVLATVAARYPAQDKLIVTAGALALSKDAGPRHVDAECGYGVVCSADGRRRFGELRVADLSQEHGQVRAVKPIDLAQFPVGSRLRILPNHSCLAAAMFDRYFVVRGDEVLDEWKTVRGW